MALARCQANASTSDARRLFRMIMVLNGLLPDHVMTLAAAATVFTVMLAIGLGIRVGDFRWVLTHRALLAKALASVLVAVPLLGVAVARAFDLSREAQIGIALMAIAPGAPIALRRSLDAGGHPTFASALQIAVALLAVASVPLSITLLNPWFAGRATIDPLQLARQVVLAQLLPIGIGMLVRAVAPAVADRLERALGRIAGVLIALLAILVVIDIGHHVVGAGLRVALAILTVSVLVLAVGHAAGGPDADTRSAVAVVSAARNPGLALLVSSLNGAPAAVNATVFAYAIISAIPIVAYVVWRRRVVGA